MVRIICEGKTDKKLGLLSHMGIEEKEGDFEIMGCKNNFFDIQKYKIIIQLVNCDQLKKLLFVLDADYETKDSRYGGYDNCYTEINKMIATLGLSSISDVIIIRDYKTNTGYLESLIFSTLSEQQKECIKNFLDCSNFISKDNHKSIINQIYKMGYPNEPYNYEHPNFQELKDKLKKLYEEQNTSGA
jgi:hypothetical protein